MVYLACQHAIKMVMMWYDRVVSSFERFEGLDLAHVHACGWNKINIASTTFMFMVNYIIISYSCLHSVLINFNACSWLLSLSRWSLPSLFLAFTCTKREYYLCIQLHEPQKLFHMSPPYLPICGIYRPFQVNLYVPNSKPSNEIMFCMLE